MSDEFTSKWLEHTTLRRRHDGSIQLWNDGPDGEYVRKSALREAEARVRELETELEMEVGTGVRYAEIVESLYAKLEAAEGREREACEILRMARTDVAAHEPDPQHLTVTIDAFLASRESPVTFDPHDRATFDPDWECPVIPPTP